MKIFAPDLKRMLKDCILSIFWPKKEIISFFKDCQCSDDFLKSINQDLKRHEIIDVVFASLSDRADNGTLQFNLMLESLVKWSHFDDFWFKQEGKLDIGAAKQKIEALKKAKEKNIDRIKQNVDKQEIINREKNAKAEGLQALKDNFYTISLSSETNQKRGYAFEKFLSSLARYYDLKVSDPFKINGTQIDGTIKYEGENYTIEAKWHSKELSDEPLMAFAHKQEINMHGRGVFISVNGYTRGALSMLERSSVKNTILVDGEDITLVLDDFITFPKMLDAKIHAAQTQGRFYINPITQKPKFRNE